jgi:tetratricopeptide (TPR) repeat protein
MAPELIEAALTGKTATGIDVARADLFSLGAVVVELLTGQLPFSTDEPGTLATLADAARKGAPGLPAALPAAVTAILRSCLASDPTQRPASARVVAAALGRFVADWRNRGRRRRGAALALVSLALIGSGVAVAVKAWPTPTPGVPVAAERPPQTADEFFARGQKYLHAGNVSAARADFIACHERSGNPWALAFVAYGMALDGQSGPSIDAARRAIKDGAVSAEVHNNLGYVLSQSARPAEAIPPLDEAIRRSPGMRAAFYNRAMARYRAGLGVGKTVDPQAAEDITTALSLGSPSADLHFDAARIYAACAARDSALWTAALEQVRAAIRAGKDPGACRSDAILGMHLGGDRALEAACLTPRGNPPAKPPQIRLVEPRL